MLCNSRASQFTSPGAAHWHGLHYGRAPLQLLLESQAGTIRRLFVRAHYKEERAVRCAGPCFFIHMFIMFDNEADNKRVMMASQYYQSATTDLFICMSE